MSDKVFLPVVMAVALAFSFDMASAVQEECKAVIEQGNISVSELDNELRRQTVACYESGAAAGSPAAQHNLALLYYHGKFKEKDTLKAGELFRMAADSGHALAAYNYAVLEENKGDLAGAKKYYEIAATGDHVTSQIIIGQNYEYLGDYGRAVEWYERASLANSGEAYFLLAGIYLRGKLGSPSIDQACKHMSISRDLGYSKAIEFFNLLKGKKASICLR